MKEALKKTKAASRLLATVSDDKRNEILLAVADAIVANKERILKANAEDLAKMDPKHPLYDRLQLTDKRLDRLRHAQREQAAVSLRSYSQGVNPSQWLAAQAC